MSFKTTVRRTLALLLVLIFALSNMGLAEMAELVADAPAEAAAVEESVDEAAAIEADSDSEAGEAEQEDETAAPVEPAGDEAPADASAPAPEEGDAEAEAPAAAESVSVVVQEIDEHSLCAYESIAPEGQWEVSYMWERALDADGEWEPLDCEGDVYATEAEDRASYVYRCTVTVGDLSATSEPVAFSGAEYMSDEQIAAIESGEETFEMTDLESVGEYADALEIKVEKGASSELIVYQIPGSLENVVVLSGSTTKTLKFTTSALDEDIDLANDYGPLTYTVYSDPNFADTAKDETSLGPTVTDKTDVNVGVTTTDYKTPKTCYIRVTAEPKDEKAAKLVGTAIVHFLPMLTATQIKGAVVTTDETPVAWTSTNVGEGESFGVEYLASKSAPVSELYGLYASVEPTDPATGKDAYKFDVTTSMKNGVETSVAKYHEDKPAPTDPDDGQPQLQFMVAVRSKYKALNDALETLNDTAGSDAASAKYTILPRPTDIAMLECTDETAESGAGKWEAVESKTKNITLVAGVDDADKVDLVLGINGVDEVNSDSKFEPDQSTTPLWLDEIKWTVSDNNFYLGSQQYVSFNPADPATKIPADGSTLVEVSAASNLATGSDVVVKATGKYWDVQSNAVVEATFTWNIKVVVPTTDTLTADFIQVTSAVAGEVGRPDDKTTLKKDYSRFTAALTGKFAGQPVEWGVSSTVGNSNQLVKCIDATNGVFEVIAKDATGYPSTDPLLNTADAGVKVTITAKLKKSGGAHGNEVTKTVTVRPYANTVTVAPSGENQQNLNQWNGNNTNDIVKVPVGKSVNLTATLSNSTLSNVKCFGTVGSVEVQLIPKGNDASPEPETASLTPSTGAITWTPSALGDYIMTVTAQTGAKAQYKFTVQKMPETLEIEAPRNVLYVTNDSSLSPNDDDLVLTTKALAGGETKDVYQGEIEWKITAAGNDPALLQHLDPTVANGAPTSGKKIGLKATAGATTATLHAEKFDDDPAGSVVGRQVIITATMKGYESLTKQFPVTITKRIDLLTALPISDFKTDFWKIDAEIDGKERGAAYNTGDHYKIAQGTTVTSSLNYADKYQVLQGMPYTIKVAAKSGSGAEEHPDVINPLKGAVENWIKVGANSATGTNEIQALPEGTNNKLAATNGNDVRKFTLTLQIEGYSSLNMTRDIYVVTQPASVVIELVQDAKDKAKTLYNKIPAHMVAGDAIAVKGVLRGPALINSTNQFMETTGPVPEIQASGATVSKYTEKNGTTQQNVWAKDAYLVQTGSNDATVTLTATTSGLQSLPVSIDIWNADLSWTGCTDKNHGSDQHGWMVIPGASLAQSGVTFGPQPGKGLTGGDPKDLGHYYICKYCGAVYPADAAGTGFDATKPAAHSHWTPVGKVKNTTTGEKYDPDMFLWRGLRPDGVEGSRYGAVECGLCGQVCDHGYSAGTPLKTGTYEYVAPEYHKGVCEICGKTVYELHTDANHDGYCELCQQNSTYITFTNEKGVGLAATVKPLVLVGGDNYVLRTNVTNAEKYEISYAITAGDTFAHIETTGTKSGLPEVVGDAPSLGAKVTVTATAKIPAVSNLLPEREVSATLDLEVKEAVTDPRMSSDHTNADDPTTAYIIADGTGSGWAPGVLEVIPDDPNNEYVTKITVNPGAGLTDPSLKGFSWKLTTDAQGQSTDSNLQFVAKSPTNPNLWVPVADPMTQTDPLTVYVRVKEGMPTSFTSSDTSVFAYVWFGNANGVYCSMPVEILKQLRNDSENMNPSTKGRYAANDRLSTAIAFDDDLNVVTGATLLGRNGYVIAQGESVKVALKVPDANGDGKPDDFDQRLVKSVRYEIVGASMVNGRSTQSHVPPYVDPNTKDMTIGDVMKWVTVDNSTGTITAKPAGPQNTIDLEGGTKQMMFMVRAVVEIYEDDHNNGDIPKTVAGVRPITIVPAPATVKLEHQVSTATSAYKTYTEIPADGISALEGSEVVLRATTTMPKKADDSKANYKVTFDWTEGCFEEDLDDDTNDFKDAKTAVGPDNKGVSSVEYRLTIKQGAPETITIPVHCAGVDYGPIVIHVAKKINSLSVSADLTQIAAGEGVTTAGDTQTEHTVTVTAVPDPLDALDEVTWKAYYADEDGKAIEDDEIPVSVVDWDYKDAKNTYEITFKVPKTRVDNITGKRTAGIVFVASAVQSTKDNTDEKVTGECLVTIYKNQTHNSELVLETAKGKESVDIASNETLEITKHGYAQGYGDHNGVDLEPKVYKEYKTGAEVAKGSVLTISQADGKYMITPVSEGTATIYVESYNNDKNATIDTNNAHVQVLTVNVGAPVSKVAKKETFDNKALTMSVGQFVEIDSDAYEAYRTSTTGGVSTDAKYETASVALKAQNPALVEITKNPVNNKWLVKGIAAGKTKLYGCVGDVACADAEMIDLTVTAKVEGIDFYRDGVKVEHQIQQQAGKTETVVLEARLNPAVADGVIEMITPESVTGFTATLDTANHTVTVVPPATGTGMMAVEAQVKNPDWKSGDNNLLNPEYFKARVEIIVTDEQGGSTEPGPDVPPIEITSDIKIVGKREIAEGETTELAIVGQTANAGIEWIAEPAGSVTIAKSADGLSATVTAGATAQTATVKALLSGVEIGRETLNILTGVKAKTPTPITLCVGEEMYLSFADSQWFEGYTDAAGDVGMEDLRNVFKVAYGAGTVNASKYLTFEYDDQGGYCTLVGAKITGKKAKQQASITVTAYNNQSITIPVTVLAQNKSFGLGDIENATISMKTTDSKSIPVTFKPSKAKLNLYSNVYPMNEDEDDYVEDGSIVFDTATQTLTTKDAIPGLYEVAVYAYRTEQGSDAKHFYVEVCEDAASATGLKLALSKPGIPDAFENIADLSSITLAIGEKVEASLVDEDGTKYAGATWSQTETKAKKQKVRVDANGVITATKKGNATVTASAGGNTVTLNIKVIAAPSSSKVVLAPNATKRTVAHGEPFQLELAPKKGTFSMSGKWYSIEWLYGDEPEPVAEKAGWYVFEDEYVEEATAIIKSSWGKITKTVSFDVKGDYADTIELPESVSLPATGTTTVRLAAAEGEYANLNWTVGGKALTKAGKKVTIQSKKIWATLSADGQSVDITTKKAATGKTVAIDVSAVAEPEHTDSTTATVAAAGTGVIPEGTQLLVGKRVVGIGEKITLKLDCDEQPLGTLEYKLTKISGKKKTVASISGSTLTGKSVGEVKVTAWLDGKEYPSVSETIYVVSKATIGYSQKPTKMAVDEQTIIGVTISGYDKDTANPLPAAYAEDVDTSDIVTKNSVTISDPSMIRVVDVVPMPTEDEEVEQAHRYAVVLEARANATTTSGKAASTRVTITPKLGKKLSTKITVVYDEAVIRGTATPIFPETVYIGKGETISMPAITMVGTDQIANVDWRFANAAQAATLGLSFTDSGKLKAAKGASVGSSTTLIASVLYGEYYYGDEDFEPVEQEVQLVIGGKVNANSQFKVQLPKTSIGLHERVRAGVAFTAPTANASGKVSWSSNKKANAAIDKTTGVITGKKVGKTAKLTAKIGSKKATETITVVPDLTSIQFHTLELNVDTAKTWYLWDYVDLPAGGVVKADATMKAQESAFWFEIDYDKENTILESVGTADGKLNFRSNAVPGTAVVKVISYNGLTDRILVVLGNGQSQGPGTVDPPTPPVTEQIPGKIELSVKGTTLDANSKATLKEGDKLLPKIVVKDTKDVEILETPDLTWTVTPEGYARILDPKTGELEALKSTQVEAGQTAKDVTVTVTVTGTEVSASYKLAIDPVMGANHLVLMNGNVKLDDFLVEKDTVANIKFAVDDVSLLPKEITKFDWTVENLTTKVLELTAGSGSVTEVKGSSNTFPVNRTGAALSATDFDIEAKKSGKGQLRLTITYGEGSKKVTLKQLFDIDVSALPKAEQIQIDTKGLLDETNNTVTLGIGDEMAFDVTLDGDYGSDPEIEAKAYEAKDPSHPTTETELNSGTDHISVTPVPTTEKGIKKFKLTIGKNASTSTKNPFRVIVKAYDEAKKEFIVRLKDGLINMDDVKVESVSTHQIITDSSTNDKNTLRAGVGETVQLKFTADSKKFSAQGLDWYVVSDTKQGSETSTEMADVVTGGDGTVSVTGKRVSKVVLGIKHLGYVDKDDPAAPLGEGSTNRFSTYVINFQPQPENPIGGTIITVTYNGVEKSVSKKDISSDSDAAIEIGVKETIKATITLDNGGTGSTYSTDIKWRVKDNATNVSFVGGNTGTSVTIRGETKTNGYVTVEAYTENNGQEIVHRSFKIQVKNAPTALVLGEGTDPQAEKLTEFKPTMLTTETKYLVLYVGKDFMATAKLISSSTRVEIEETGRNTWTVTANQGAADEQVTLTLTSEDLGLTQSFNLLVKGAMNSAPIPENAKGTALGVSSTSEVKASELIQDDTQTTTDPETGITEVTGVIKEVTGFKGFSNNEDEQDGHFYPLQLSTDYSGKWITVLGYPRSSSATGPSSASTHATSKDLNWTLKIDNNQYFEFYVTANTTTGKDDQQLVNLQPILKLDFSKAKMPTAALPSSDDRETNLASSGTFQNVKPSQFMDENVKLTWDSNGTTAKVTGTLLPYENMPGFGESPHESPYFFFLKLDKKHESCTIKGKNSSAEVWSSSTPGDLDILIQVEKGEKFQITCTNEGCNDPLDITLDFTDVTFGENP